MLTQNLLSFGLNVQKKNKMIFKREEGGKEGGRERGGQRERKGEKKVEKEEGRDCDDVIVIIIL